jgi:hypothetical protein
MLALVRIVSFAFALALVGAASSEQHLLTIATGRSTLRVFVYKEGIFAFAADNHEVDVPIASGSYDDAGKMVEVKVDATKMQVLDPPSRRDKVQTNMVGPAVLDVAKFPDITFHSTQIEFDDPDHWRVTGDLTLHGQTHPVVLRVTRKDSMHFAGSATIRQTTFGISPLKIAGGTVRVKDDVYLVFDIVLQ